MSAPVSVVESLALAALVELAAAMASAGEWLLGAAGLLLVVALDAGGEV